MPDAWAGLWMLGVTADKQACGLCRWERATANICAAIFQAVGPLLAAHTTGVSRMKHQLAVYMTRHKY